MAKDLLPPTIYEYEKQYRCWLLVVYCCAVKERMKAAKNEG